MTRFIPLVVLCLLAPSGAFADDGSCRAGAVTREHAIRAARDVGMARIDEVSCDDGKWEVEGWHADGREMEVDVSARDGRILDIDYD